MLGVASVEADTTIEDELGDVASLSGGDVNTKDIRQAISCGRNAATSRRRVRQTVFSEVRAHVFPHLVMPVGPFVSALRAPVVQVMSNPPAC